MRVDFVQPADLDGLRSLSNLLIPLVVMTMFPIPGVVFSRKGTELRSGTGREVFQPVHSRYQLWSLLVF